MGSINERAVILHAGKPIRGPWQWLKVGGDGNLTSVEAVKTKHGRQMENIRRS